MTSSSSPHGPLGLAVAVSVCGPTIWNKLSQDQRSTDTGKQFKRRLKGWLFECAYGRAGGASNRHWRTLQMESWIFLLTYLAARSLCDSWATCLKKVRAFVGSMRLWCQRFGVNTDSSDEDQIWWKICKFLKVMGQKLIMEFLCKRWGLRGTEQTFLKLQVSGTTARWSATLKACRISCFSILLYSYTNWIFKKEISK